MAVITFAQTNVVVNTLQFSPDCAIDIGQAAAFRPRDLFLCRNAVIGGTLTAGNTTIKATGVGGLTLDHPTSFAIVTWTTAGVTKGALSLNAVNDFTFYDNTLSGFLRITTTTVRPFLAAALTLGTAGNPWGATFLGGNLTWPLNDNAFDIGAAGATRPRTIYVGTSIVVAGDPGGTAIVRIGGNLTVNGTTGILTLGGEAGQLRLQRSSASQVNFLAESNANADIGIATLHTSTGNINRPDDAGIAFQVGNGTNTSFANPFNFKDVTGLTLLAQMTTTAFTPGSAGLLTFGTKAVLPWGDASIGVNLNFHSGATLRFSLASTSTDNLFFLDSAGATALQLGTVALVPGAVGGRALGTATLPFGPLTFTNAAGGNISAGKGELSGGGGVSPIGARLAFGTDGTGWQLRFAKNNAGVVTDFWAIVDTGHLLAVTDNSFDIGANGATRPRDLWLGRNLNVTGTSLLAGDATIGVSARLVFQANASKIVPGATSLSLRNNADSADNLLVNDAGDAHFRTTVDTVTEYRVNATRVVGARVTGWSAWTGTADRTSHNADAPATNTQLGQALKALLDDLRAHGLIGT